jgi:hypothetical protein
VFEFKPWVHEFSTHDKINLIEIRCLRFLATPICLFSLPKPHLNPETATEQEDSRARAPEIFGLVLFMFDYIKTTQAT